MNDHTEIEKLVEEIEKAGFPKAFIDHMIKAFKASLDPSSSKKIVEDILKDKKPKTYLE